MRTKLARAGAVVLLGSAAAVAPSVVANAAGLDTTRVSVATDGTEGDKNSNFPSLSTDGRFVAFGSNATNLVPGDTNDAHDIFLHDRRTRVTELVSVGIGGAPANDASSSARVSGNGRFVTYYSDASNLVADDTNSVTDVFVYDRRTRQNIRVPGGAEGALFPDINGNGRFVTYSTNASLVPEDSNGFMDVYVFDRIAGRVSLVSRKPDGTAPVGTSFGSSISRDGRYVAYQSSATDVVPGGGGLESQIYLYDRQADTTTLVSVASDGAPAVGGSFMPSVSANGRFIAFGSRASNLVEDDANGEADIFVHDRVTGRTTAVSTTPDGETGNDFSSMPDISDDGRYVGFWSTSTNLTDVEARDVANTFVHDRRTGRNTLVSTSGAGWSVAVSGRGQFVAFHSFGDEYVTGDTNGVDDVFVSQLH